MVGSYIGKERRTDCIEIPADINPHILLDVFVECEGSLTEPYRTIKEWGGDGYEINEETEAREMRE